MNGLLRSYRRYIYRFVMCYEVDILSFTLQARANKSKDKPDSELDEFEKVNEEFCIRIEALTSPPRFLRSINCRDKKTKRWRNA